MSFFCYNTYERGNEMKISNNKKTNEQKTKITNEEREKLNAFIQSKDLQIERVDNEGDVFQNLNKQTDDFIKEESKFWTSDQKAAWVKYDSVYKNQLETLDQKFGLVDKEERTHFTNEEYQDQRQGIIINRYQVANAIDLEEDFTRLKTFENLCEKENSRLKEKQNELSEINSNRSDKYNKMKEYANKSAKELLNNEKVSSLNNYIYNFSEKHTQRLQQVINSAEEKDNKISKNINLNHQKIKAVGLSVKNYDDERRPLEFPGLGDKYWEQNVVKNKSLRDIEENKEQIFENVKKKSLPFSKERKALKQVKKQEALAKRVQKLKTKNDKKELKYLKKSGMIDKKTFKNRKKAIKINDQAMNKNIAAHSLAVASQLNTHPELAVLRIQKFSKNQHNNLNQEYAKQIEKSKKLKEIKPTIKETTQLIQKENENKITLNAANKKIKLAKFANRTTQKIKDLQDKSSDKDEKSKDNLKENENKNVKIKSKKKKKDKDLER